MSNTNLTLRPHQERALNELRSGWKQFNSHLMQAPTGAGKTAIAAEIIAGMERNGLKVIFVAPYVTLVEQTVKAFESYGLPEVGVIWRDHPSTDPNKAIQIASADTLIRRNFPDCDLVIVDECFPAGTKVDGFNIEEIKVGDLVNSYNESTKQIEKKKVLATSKEKTTSPIVSLYIKGHNRIDCTAGHRFFTQRGWIAAANLRKEDRVLINELEKPEENVRSLSERIYDFVSTIQKRREKAKHKPLLLERLRKYIQKKPWKKAAKKNDRGQPNEVEGNKGEGFSHTCENWSQTAYSTREWNRNDKSRADTLFQFEGIGICVRVGGQDWSLQGWEWLSNLLQNRYSKFRFKTWNRGRRWISLFAKKERAGQEEGKLLNWKRVDDIEIRKSRDYWEYSGSDQKGYVYNIEVEDNNNYLVNGVVVHNCHIRRKKLLELMEQKNQKWVGLTATPFANWLGTYYENFIKVTTIRDLINQGYLSDYDVYAPTKPNLKGVRTSNLAAYGRDYVESQLEEIMGEATIVGDIVSTWLEKGESEPTIAFCVNVSHANHVTVAFNRAGAQCEVMTAETPIHERQSIVSRFEQGITKIICNVGVLVAGFDSDVRCIIYARPTKSEARWLQCIGRGLRTAKGKERCIVLDHSGTVLRLGLPCSIEYDELPGTSDGMSEQEQRRKQKEKEEKKPKECPKCNYMKPAGEYQCKKCGYKPLTGEDVEVDEDRELQLLKGEHVISKQQKQEFFSELIGYMAEVKLNKGKVYKFNWPNGIFKNKFGHWPDKTYHRAAKPPTKETRNYIKSQMIRFAKSRQKEKLPYVQQMKGLIE